MEEAVEDTIEVEPVQEVLEPEPEIVQKQPGEKPKSKPEIYLVLVLAVKICLHSTHRGGIPAMQYTKIGFCLFIKSIMSLCSKMKCQ